VILPVQVTFRDAQPYKEAEQWVREEAAKLDEFYPKITSCLVLVEAPHRHRQWGNPYQVRVDLSVPGKELVITNEPSVHSSAQRAKETRRAKRLEIEARHKDLHLVIRNAFRAARRQLQDYVRRHRRELKTHETPPRARVSRLVPEQGYGFLTTPDGREIYFHEKSVLNAAFSRLEVGSEVNFAEEEGEKGAQASTVRITRHHQSPYAEKKSRRRVRAVH
jgi:cold shock CspA family protein